jgi:hypothetical protein
MDSIYPEDILEFLQQSGFDERRIDVLKANVVTSFSNPKNIADIITFRYPRLLHHSVIRDANSSSLRLENWRLLNKTLSTLRCELNEDRIISLGNKRCSKDDIFALLRVLKIKLDAYEPLYLAKFNPGMSMSASQSKSTTMSSSSARIESSTLSQSKVVQSSNAVISTSSDNTNPLVPADVDFESFDIMESIASAKKTSSSPHGDPAHNKSTLFGSEVKLPISKILASGKSLTMKYDQSIKPAM